jgi:hypothetical protein
MTPATTAPKMEGNADLISALALMLVEEAAGAEPVVVTTAAALVLTGGATEAELVAAFVTEGVTGVT